MNSTLKTALVVFSILIIIFTILFFYVDAFAGIIKKNRNDLESKFYSQLDHDKKKIFFVGSSQVGRLNETYIQEYLHNNNRDYEIYNLAVGAEEPNDRLQYINSMIAAKPDIVIYGVGYRDFVDDISQFDLTKPTSSLPDPSRDFKYGMVLLERFLNYDFDKFRSPQLVFRYVMRDYTDLNKNQNVSPTYTESKPFYPYDKRETIIMNDTQLQKSAEDITYKFSTIPPYDENQYVYAWKQIIEKLKENNIKVIIFSTPHTEFYTEKVGPDNKNEFDQILQRVSQEEGVHAYLLRDKYIGLPIWSDNYHIAVNPKALIYSQDIAKIILNETRP